MQATGEEGRAGATLHSSMDRVGVGGLGGVSWGQGISGEDGQVLGVEGGRGYARGRGFLGPGYQLGGWPSWGGVGGRRGYATLERTYCTKMDT